MESFNSPTNGSTSDFTVGAHTREPEFQKLCQTIGTSIQKINQNVVHMERMVRQFGTQQISPEVRQQFNSLQQYTRKLVQDTNGAVKELSSFPPSPLHAEQQQRKMQRTRLQDEFTSALNAFQSAQRNAAKKERDLVKEARAHANPDPFGSRRDQQLIELHDNNMTPKQQQQQQMAQQEEVDLRNLLEQEEAIQQLERDIVDVNQIFKELGTLVHEQGEVIDSIESSVERTETYTGQAAQQLREAHTYKNKVVKKKIYLAIIAAVILIILITIVVVSIKN